MKRIPLAVIGAGLIGRTHVDRALRSPDVHLVGIADPSETGRRCQRRHNPIMRRARSMIDAGALGRPV